MQKSYKHPIDRYFKRNAMSISTVEFFWGLALPVLFESTFLQIFLRQIGASHLTVGLIPTIQSAGTMLFSLMSAYLTSHLVHKKRWVILSHVLAGIPIIAFGLILNFIEADSRVAAFITCYTLFSMMLGLTLPMWQNFTVMIFSNEMAIRGLSIMITTQITTKLIGGLLIFRSIEKFSFSTGSASVIFLVAGVLCLAGAFFFLPARELPDETSAHAKKRHNLHSMYIAGKNILSNRNYMLYLLSSVETYATITVISFYANYAVECRGIGKETAAGLFVVSIYSAGILINLLTGWLGLFSIKTKFIIARLSAITGTLLLPFLSTAAGFISASFIIGISRGINQSAHSPAVRRLSGLHDATDYFALSALFVFPFSAGIPLASGLILDARSSGDARVYIFLFSALALIQAASLIMTLITDFNER